MKVKELSKKSSPRIDNKFIQALNIQTYGEDNLYPQVFRDIVHASPSGNECIDQLADFIEGNGFKDELFSEYRQLADQSSESAEKISQIVAELVRNSNTSVDTMDTVLTDITDQFDKLNTTRKVFDKLNAEINNVANAVESITDQVDSINTVKNEVLGSVESLAAIAQENAASTEETSAAMFELGQIVNDCNESTQQLVTLSNEMTDNANKFKL